MTITLTAAFGYALALLLIGGTIAVYGARFLAWTDRRRPHKQASHDAPPSRDPFADAPPRGER